MLVWPVAWSINVYCAYIFSIKYFLGCFFFLFSFGDILAAGDYWVKLLRTLQNNGGRLVLYAEGHERQHELLGTLQHALKEGEIYIYISIYIFLFLLCLNCHECARGTVPCQTGIKSYPARRVNLPWNALLLKHSERDFASSSWWQ